MILDNSLLARYLDCYTVLDWWLCDCQWGMSLWLAVVTLLWLTTLIEAEWGIYTSVNKAIIGSDNGLVPVWYQAIICTNAGLLLIVPFHKDFSPSGEQLERRKLAHES